MINALDINEIEEMFSSHTWKIQSVKDQATGLDLALICGQCGTETVTMIHYIERPELLAEIELSAKMGKGALFQPARNKAP